jgi:hypothetical protein
MKAICLITALVCCCCLTAAEETLHKLGPFTIDQVKKFESSSASDKILAIATDTGLTMNFYLATTRPDVDAQAKDAVPDESKPTLKAETVMVDANGLTGKRVILRFKDFDQGNSVIEMGYLGQGETWVTWQITGKAGDYAKEAQTIAAIIKSIKK